MTEATDSLPGAVMPVATNGQHGRDAAAWVLARADEATAARGEAAAALMERLHLGPDCIAAAWLCALQPNATTEREVGEVFGADVVRLLLGVWRLASMQGLARVIGGVDEGVAGAAQALHRAQQTEALRKMLLAMVDDVRVVLIKLGERLVSLRQAARSTDARRNDSAQSEAREVMAVFAPLANRLGVWQLKWELEDLSLRILDPHQYHTIARYLDETRIEREAYIDTTKALLRDALSQAGIDCEISGRSKHIYSIYEKQKRKRCSLEQLYDIRAVRVMVAEVKDCYATLGIVHSMFQPIPGEFDDYIAKPKANNYRSLHTSVIGPQGRALEVQIRTREMHQASEYGVAAHWNYKEGGGARDAAFASKLANLRQVLSWGRELSATGDALAGVDTALFDETVFVLTPQGRIIDLPRDATPLDFAYAVHTGLGHRCRGAKVDGVMVPLTTSLHTGQRVEIITVKEGGPSRDWLNPDSGYIRGSRARSKVRQWFNALDLQETTTHGRAVIDKALQRHGQTGINLERLAHEAGFRSPDELYAAVGRAEVNSRDLDLAVRKASGLAEATEEPARPVATARSRAKADGGGILVVGVDKLLTGLAKCCNPVPPDPIVGFVSRLKGVTIHRANCANARRLAANEPDRIIDAEWGDTATGDVFTVQVVVIASDRQGLLRDVSDVLAREKINVTAVNTLTRDFVARMKFTAEVRSLDQLRLALAQVAQVKGVQSARRI